MNFRLTFFILAAILMLTVSCDRDRNNPGWDFFPDMYYSKAYETHTANPALKGGITDLSPVEGTIPRGMVPYQYSNTKEGMEKAGKELVNPLTETERNLERGKEVYNIFCLHCHGEKGDGKGSLHTSGKYIYPPANLINNKMEEKPDGEIYHSVTVGYGLMGAHGSQILPDDRWKLIMYIRNELQK